MAPAPPVLEVHQLSVVFPDNNGGLLALDHVSFDICPQEFVCVLGASGSGKTTLLRTLAGLLQPTHGRADFSHGRTPRIGMVFQQSNLMPWRTVSRNITLPLELDGSRPEAARKRAQEMIDLVGLQGFEQSLPRDLSGGRQKHRDAMIAGRIGYVFGRVRDNDAPLCACHVIDVVCSAAAFHNCL